ncbi:hypothetical protein N0V88_000625 [Collariella sp. IMI 366227]|nr:hypothetical protein N0V88_000625 [Collariella sp. IMI 366227]
MDETSNHEMPPSPEPQESSAVPDVPEEMVTNDEMNETQQSMEDNAGSPPEEDFAASVSETISAAEEQPATEIANPEPAVEAQHNVSTVDTASEEASAANLEDAAQVAVAAEEDAPPAQADLATDPILQFEAPSEPDADVTPVDTAVFKDPASTDEDQENQVHDEEVLAPQVTPDDASEAKQEESEPTAEAHAATEMHDVDDPVAAEKFSNAEAPFEDEAGTLPQGNPLDDGSPHHPIGDRKTSLRTEALIQAAARAVVAKIEKRKSGHVIEEHEEAAFDNSLLSTASHDTYLPDDTPTSPSQPRHILPIHLQHRLPHLPATPKKKSSAATARAAPLLPTFDSNDEEEDSTMDDYEVLEERLLEALELPVKRRARILECGHYLGPANVMVEDLDEEEEEESEDEEEEKRHWCKTCREEIRMEALGAGRVFRVKVYASNGLMKAGAWEACWKEMERVDVEVEPIVEAGVHGELEKLAALQMEMEEQRRQEDERAREAELEAEVKREMALEQELRAESRQQEIDAAVERELEAQAARLSSPAPLAMQLVRPQSSSSNFLIRAGTPTLMHHTRPGTPLRQSETIDDSDERQRRDEERMREIYGDQNNPYSQALTPAPPPMPMLLTDGRYPHDAHPYDSYAHDRRQNAAKQQPPRTFDENSGFVELLMEAFKVLLRDPKNVAIIVLCVFVVVMVRRPGMGETGLQPVLREAQAPAVVVKYEAPLQKEAQMELESFVSSRVEEVVVSGVVEDSWPGSAADTLVAVPVPVVSTVEEVPAPVVEELEQQPFPVISDSETMLAAEEVSEDATEVENLVEEGTLGFTSWADIIALLGPQYPLTLAGEAPFAEESEALEDTAVRVEETVDTLDLVEDELVTDPEESLDTDEALLTPSVDGTSSVEKAAIEPELDTASEALQADLNTATSTEPVEDTQSDVDDVDSDLESNEEEQCNNQATPSSSASTSAVFVPGPFVTQHKTVRVFETVTETVRVSVVTETETVSTVVTAIPQTVEETVYETETIKITVSVPVEEQDGIKKKAKATAAKGKRGKSCGRLL